MKRTRTLAVVLVALSSLAACGSEAGTTTEVAPPSAGTATSAPAPAATTSSAPPEAASRGGGADATELCKQADEAKKILVTLFAEALSGTEPDAAKVKKAMGDLGAELTKIGTSGGTSEAAVAMKEYGAELAKSAAAPDPFEAPNAAAAEKAGERVDAACAKA